MNIAINTTKDNVYLGRKELYGVVSFKGTTPSNANVKKEIVKLQKSKDDMVYVKKVLGHYGSAKANLVAYVYTDAESRNRLEGKPKEEAKPAAGKPVEAKETSKESPPAEKAPEATVEEVPKEAAPAEEKQEAKTE